jgi:hypothetical protein
MVLKDGTNLLIVYNLFTKLVALYHMPDKTALSCARALFMHFVTYGTCDVLHSDMGSDFQSSTVDELLNGWMGVRQTFALARNPQADGVEPEVKEVIKHLSCLMFDSGVEADYAKPENLMCVQLIINEVPHSSTSVIPLEATYGDFTSIPAMPEGVCSHAYVEKLGSNLAALRAVSIEYRAKMLRIRSIKPDAVQNRFQPGDLVLYKLHKQEKATKLRAIHRGPYEVRGHPEGSNHVQVRQLTGNQAYFTFDVKDLSIFVGSRQLAVEAANKDEYQFEIKEITSFRGDVSHRSRMEFLVHYADGDVLWVPYSLDLATTEALERFCMQSRYKALQMLLLPTKLINNSIKMLNSAVVDLSKYKEGVFINLRSYGGDWYDSRTSLPSKDTTNYYFKCTVKWNGGKRDAKKYVLYCPVLGESTTHDGAYMYYYGNVTELQPGEVELTNELCYSYDLFA